MSPEARTSNNKSADEPEIAVPTPGGPPELDWLEDGVPRAARFCDTYFSRAGGLQETRHVFLGGNDLPRRFDGRESFTIAEFGFGTGLNFLTVLDALGAMPSPPRLTFVSFELYPMTRDQVARALAAFPEIADFVAQLLDVWAVGDGWNRMTVAGADLIVGVGDARTLICSISTEPAALLPADGLVVAPVDAWFLDGFSPARNPELWGVELFGQAAGLSAADATLATYSAAGWVRRNLAAAGFNVEKYKGFAGKREMVAGRLHSGSS